MLLKAGTTPQLDQAAAVQILVYDTNNWLSYDDATTLKMKVDYANQNCLGGTMVWASSLDDLEGSAAKALAGTNPLSNTHIGTVTDPVSQCFWTPCTTAEFNPACPDGTTNVAAIPDGYPQPTAPPYLYRMFCCPSDDVPQCYDMYEFNALPACNPQPCHPDQSLITTSQFPYGSPNTHCETGQVNVCCDNKPSLSIISQCSWTDCGVATCPTGWYPVTKSKTGDGGSPPCATDWRQLCCPSGGTKDLNPATCLWYGNAFHGTCTPGCPEGKVMIAVDSEGAGCTSGFGSFCCNPPGEDVTSASAQVEAFQAQVESFMTSKICDLTNQPVPTKRQAGAVITTMDMTNLIMPYLYALEYEYDELAGVQVYQAAWDATNSANGNIFPSFSSLANSLYQYMASDDGTASDLINQELCGGAVTASALSSAQAAAQNLCTVDAGTCDSSVKRSFGDYNGEEDEGMSSWANATDDTAASRSPLEKRTFISYWNTDFSVLFPGITTSWFMLNEIVGGPNSARLEYFKWFRQSPRRIMMEVVYLLGPDPFNLNINLQSPRTLNGWGNRYCVVHLHFGNCNLSPTGHLLVTQINIRHGWYMLNRPNSHNLPGSFNTITEVPVGHTGDEIWNCRTARPAGSFGTDPTNRLVNAVNTQAALIQQLLALINSYGVNHDLLNLLNPDPSTLVRTEMGPNAGDTVPDPITGQAFRMFTLVGGRPQYWTILPAYGAGTPFTQDGRLYSPLIENGGDLVQAGPFVRGSPPLNGGPGN